MPPKRLDQPKTYTDEEGTFRTHGHLLAAKQKWSAQLEISCQGKLSLMLGGHSSFTNTMYVRCLCEDVKAHKEHEDSSPVYDLEEWVFKHCRHRAADLDGMEDDEIDQVCMESCIVERMEALPGVAAHRGMTLRDLVRLTCACFGGPALAGLSVWIYWCDQPHGAEDSMDAVSRGLAVTRSTIAERRDLGVWYKADILGTDDEAGTIHVHYPADQSDHKICVPLSLVHWGLQPPLGGHLSNDARAVARAPPSLLLNPTPADSPQQQQQQQQQVEGSAQHNLLDQQQLGCATLQCMQSVQHEDKELEAAVKAGPDTKTEGKPGLPLPPASPQDSFSGYTISSLEELEVLDPYEHDMLNWGANLTSLTDQRAQPSPPPYLPAASPLPQPPHLCTVTRLGANSHDLPAHGPILYPPSPASLPLPLTSIPTGAHTGSIQLPPSHTHTSSGAAQHQQQQQLSMPDVDAADVLPLLLDTDLDLPGGVLPNQGHCTQPHQGLGMPWEGPEAMELDGGRLGSLYDELQYGTNGEPMWDDYRTLGKEAEQQVLGKEVHRQQQEEVQHQAEVQQQVLGREGEQQILGKEVHRQQQEEVQHQAEVQQQVLGREGEQQILGEEVHRQQQEEVQQHAQGMETEQCSSVEKGVAETRREKGRAQEEEQEEMFDAEQQAEDEEVLRRKEEQKEGEEEEDDEEDEGARGKTERTLAEGGDEREKDRVEKQNTQQRQKAQERAKQDDMSAFDDLGDEIERGKAMNKRSGTDAAATICGKEQALRTTAAATPGRTGSMGARVMQAGLPGSPGLSGLLKLGAAKGLFKPIGDRGKDLQPQQQQQARKRNLEDEEQPLLGPAGGAQNKKSKAMSPPLSLQQQALKVQEQGLDASKGGALRPPSSPIAPAGQGPLLYTPTRLLAAYRHAKRRMAAIAATVMPAPVLLHVLEPEQIPTQHPQPQQQQQQQLAGALLERREQQQQQQQQQQDPMEEEQERGKQVQQEQHEHRQEVMQEEQEQQGLEWRQQEEHIQQQLLQHQYLAYGAWYLLHQMIATVHMQRHGSVALNLAPGELPLLPHGPPRFFSSFLPGRGVCVRDFRSLGLEMDVLDWSQGCADGVSDSTEPEHTPLSDDDHLSARTSPDSQHALMCSCGQPDSMGADSEHVHTSSTSQTSTKVPATHNNDPPASTHSDPSPSALSSISQPNCTGLLPTTLPHTRLMELMHALDAAAAADTNTGVTPQATSSKQATHGGEKASGAGCSRKDGQQGLWPAGGSDAGSSRKVGHQGLSSRVQAECAHSGQAGNLAQQRAASTRAPQASALSGQAELTRREVVGISVGRLLAGASGAIGEQGVCCSTLMRCVAAVGGGGSEGMGVSMGGAEGIQQQEQQDQQCVADQQQQQRAPLKQKLDKQQAQAQVQQQAHEHMPRQQQLPFRPPLPKLPLGLQVSFATGAGFHKDSLLSDVAHAPGTAHVTGGEERSCAKPSPSPEPVDSAAAGGGTAAVKGTVLTYACTQYRIGPWQLEVYHPVHVTEEHKVEHQGPQEEGRWQEQEQLQQPQHQGQDQQKGQLQGSQQQQQQHQQKGQQHDQQRPRDTCTPAHGRCFVRLVADVSFCLGSITAASENNDVDDHEAPILCHIHVVLLCALQLAALVCGALQRRASLSGPAGSSFVSGLLRCMRACTSLVRASKELQLTENTHAHLHGSHHLG